MACRACSCAKTNDLLPADFVYDGTSTSSAFEQLQTSIPEEDEDFTQKATDAREVHLLTLSCTFQLMVGITAPSHHTLNGQSWLGFGHVDYAGNQASIEG